MQERLGVALSRPRIPRRTPQELVEAMTLLARARKRLPPDHRAQGPIGEALIELVCAVVERLDEERRREG